MTFKKMVTLSIIMIFALGTFALAEDPCDNTPTTTASTVTASNDSQHTSTVAPVQNNASTTNSTSTTNTTKNTTASQSDKGSKTVKKSVKKNTSKQETPSLKTPSTKEKTVSPTKKAVPEGKSNVTHVSPAPQRYYSNRNYGYTRQQIRNMPMVARPDRPGHFFGNTVRALYRARRGR